MAEYIINFICPHCQHDEVVLVEKVYQTSIIDRIYDDGEIETGYPDISEAEDSWFECLNCGDHIASHEKNLLTFLRENNMLEEVQTND